MSARADHGRITRPVRIGYSLPWALLQVAATGGGTLWLAWFAFIGVASGHIVLGMAGLLGCGVFVPLMAPLLRDGLIALRAKGEVVTLDDLGVTDTRLDPSFVAWADVGRIELGVGHTRSILGIEFRDRAVAREHIGVLRRARTLLRRTRWLGDWNIDLRLLACKPAQVLADAQRLHRQSIRERIVELNRERDQGWSGRL